MAATVRLVEYNGAEETATNDPANVNMGSVDAAELDSVANPIVPGENSFEKYHRLEVTDMGGDSVIKNIKVWRTGALGGSAVHLTNARETNYGGAESYATPVATTSSVATQTMPTSKPAGANLGIGGSLTGELTEAGLTDRLVHQIQTDAEDTEGASTTLNFEYERVA